MTKSNINLFCILFGVFALMALSNAIVPILPDLDGALHIQALIFSSYFFGAMVTTLPGGIISERFGQIPVILAGLMLNLIAGIFLLLVLDPLFFLLARIIEGVGAGLFVASALSWINHQPGHIKLSGAFMALLNLGLLAGLLGAGWISHTIDYSKGGILLFTALLILPLIPLIGKLFCPKDICPGEIIIDEKLSVPGWKVLMQEVVQMIIRQAPLWFSVIILLGITGFVQAVYPELSNLTPLEIGSALALMNLATIIASLSAPWVKIEPVLLIRISAIVMGALVLVFLQFPLSVFFMGIAAGLIMIAQINYLSLSEKHQGIAMGLFSTSSYAGMTLLPIIGGTIIGLISFFAAVCIIALLAVCSAVFIGRCQCRGFFVPEFK